MSNKTPVDINFLKNLKDIAVKNDNLPVFADIAIEWAEQASNTLDETFALLKDAHNIYKNTGFSYETEAMLKDWIEKVEKLLKKITQGY